MTQEAAKRSPTASKAARRAKALVLLSEGAEVGDVAKKLGVSRETITRWQRVDRPAIDAAAEALVDGVVEGGARAKALLAERGEAFAQTLWDASRNQLRIGLTAKQRAMLGEDDEVPIENDPQMVNARVNAAAKGLAFIIATKSEHEHSGSIFDAIAKAAKRQADDEG
jgi:hypothetical protein